MAAKCRLETTCVPIAAPLPLTTRRTLRIICPDGVISTEPRYWAVPTLRPTTITRTESPTGTLLTEKPATSSVESTDAEAASPAARLPARASWALPVTPFVQNPAPCLVLYVHAPPVGAVPQPGDCARSNRSPAITGFGFGAELSVKLVPVVVPTSTPLR